MIPKKVSYPDMLVTNLATFGDLETSPLFHTNTAHHPCVHQHSTKDKLCILDKAQPST